MTRTERENLMCDLRLAKADAEDAAISLGEAIDRLRREHPMSLPWSRACQSLDRALSLVRKASE